MSASMGDIAESKVKTKFQEYGMKEVFVPTSHNSRIDMIVQDLNNDLHRIQVKSSGAKTDNNSTIYHIEQNGLYDDTQIDYFVLYNFNTGTTCMISVNDPVVKGKTRVYLSQEDPSIKRIKNVNYEKDYLMESVLEKDFGLRKLEYSDLRPVSLGEDLKKDRRKANSDRNKPNKEMLFNWLEQHKTLNDIASTCDVVIDSVKKWIKEYGLDSEEWIKDLIS